MLRPSTALNQALRLEAKLEPQRLPVVEMQHEAVALLGPDEYVAVPWGQPRKYNQTHRPSDNKFSNKTEPSPKLFLALTLDATLLMKTPTPIVVESARLYAEHLRLSGNELLQLNRCLARLCGYRKGTVLDIATQLPGQSPRGSEAVGVAA